MKEVRLGTGTAYWGDTLQPAKEMVERADIDYLCCDHLAELTMSMLAKRRERDPGKGYTSDIVPLLRSVLPTALERGIKIVSNAGGANPMACGQAIVELCWELGLSGVKIGVVLGDDIVQRIDELDTEGVDFTNLDTGEPFSAVRDRLTHANVYMGSEGVLEALQAGADIVIAGRITDIALYLGPMMHELGWAADDYHKLGAGTGLAHIVECGGQAMGGIYAGGWRDVPDLEHIGYPVLTVREDGTGIVSKTPDTGGEVSVGTLSEQLVYEIHDPGAYLTADVTADISQVRLTQLGHNQVAVDGLTGTPRPEQLKVNIGYRSGFIGEAQVTYTWPDAVAKSRAGIEFLERRLTMAGFEAEATRVEYLGHNSMWGDTVPPPESEDLTEVVIRYAARTQDPKEARKVFTESVSLYNNGPAGAAAIGTRTPVKELFAAWPALVPRSAVKAHVEMLEV